jgi:O-antigen ligase
MTINHVTGSSSSSVYRPLARDSSWAQAAVQGLASKPALVFDRITIAFLFLFALAQPLSMAATHIAYTGAAVAWILRLVFVRRRLLTSSPLDAPILIYLLLCAAATLHSPLPASSWEGMRKINLIFCVLLFAQNVTTTRRAKQLVGVLFLSGLASVVWAGWEYAEGVGLRVHNPAPGTAFYSAGIRDLDVVLRVDGQTIASPQRFVQYLNARPADEPIRLRVVHGGGIEVLKDAVPVVLSAGGWPRASNVNELGMQIETARPARARSFYSHYVTYASVLDLLACLAFGLWLSYGRQNRFWSLTLGAVFLAFAVALGMTLTRAAWLTLAFGCVVQIWFYLKQLHLRRWSIVLGLAAVLLIVTVGTSAAMHRWRGMGIIDLNDPGDAYRVTIWRDGFRLIKEHPWFGVGMNTVRDAWWQYHLEAFEKYGLQSHFHSTPIQIAVELGIPVLACWLVLMGAYWLMLVRLVTRAREQHDTFAYGLALGILGGTSAFLASSLVHYDYGDSVVVFLFWFLAGLALAVRQQLENRRSPSVGSPS